MDDVAPFSLGDELETSPLLHSALYVHCTYMLTRKITTSGNSAAITLSPDLLGLLDVAVGDEVELQLVGRSLVIRPIDEARREQALAKSTDRVLKRRRKLMERLAEGVGADVGAEGVGADGTDEDKR